MTYAEQHAMMESTWNEFVKPSLGGDWKGPIHVVVFSTDADRVAEAIAYFTATEPERSPATITATHRDGFVPFELSAVRLTSVGYRMGPAGP